jgi:hypothetical protein
MARNDFPVISDRRRPGDDGPREVKPGDSWEETVYEDIGGDWKKREWGEEIGNVTLRHSRAPDQGIEVQASFRFHDDDTVEVSGPVPGKGTWRGKGSLRIVEGKGKFANRKDDEVPVDSTNPKRWG